MGNGLRAQARRVLLQQVAPAYRRALGPQKQQILGEFVTATGYARKYAQWLLNHSEEVLAPPTALLRRYGPEVEEALVLIWKTLNRICSKRLIPFLPSIVATLEEHLQAHRTVEHRPKTLEWHQMALAHFQQYVITECHILLVNQITETTVSGWLAFLRQAPTTRGTPRAATTIETYARSARAFFAWLVERGAPACSPMSERSFPRTSVPSPHVISPATFSGCSLRRG